ncbi:MAG: hypothetical protein E7812_09700 [Phenylobacterium sp.]|nr:MAG: hypothetical protein E7812_09700 [Phenylobacterium sp.]
MDPKAVIESYADDVVRRLPRRQRSDVGLELRSLLGEELDAKAMGAGRSADEAMALALLRDFGSPETVAARYRPSGFTIIELAQSRAFALWSLAGVAVQWALTLPSVFSVPEAFPGQTLTRLGGWWTSWGLGAFWLPGFMVVVAIVAGWSRHRWPRERAWTPRRVLDPDHLNRPLLAVGLAAWAAYMALLAVEPRLLGALPQPVATVFTFDADFLRTRGPWLFPVWGGQFLVCAAALVAGRWTRRTRELNAVFGAGVCAVLAWFVVAGPIFTAKAADDTTKGVVGLVVLLWLISLGIGLYRWPGRSDLPEGLAAPPVG